MILSRTLHLIHLEDDPLDAELVRTHLEDSGLSVEMRVATRREEFVAALDAGGVDLIVSDYSLPAFDGLSALALLREVDQETPFILFSGALGEDRAVECLRLGATDTILKSRLERLAPAVKRALREAQERRERRRAEERFALAMEAIEAAVYDAAPGDDLYTRSDRFADLVGCLPEEIVPDAAWWRDRIHPDEQEAVRSALMRAFDGDDHYGLEYRVRTDAGEWIHVWDRGVVLRDAGGAVARVVGSVLDVTPRVRAEAALRERQRQIEDLNRRLQRAIAESHHRIKNNLQVLVALVETMRIGAPRDTPAAGMDRLARHIRALASLHDLLTLETRTPDADLDTVPAHTVLERLASVLETAADPRRIRLAADPIRLGLKQCGALSLLVNELVANAVKHGRGTIGVALRADGDTHVLLEVADEGDGFPTGFDPSRAAHTGLDLIESIGRWDLGGEIAYVNDGGARVRVRFPRTQEKSPSPLPPSIA